MNFMKFFTLKIGAEHELLFNQLTSEAYLFFSFYACIILLLILLRHFYSELELLLKEVPFLRLPPYRGYRECMRYLGYLWQGFLQLS